MSIPSISSSSDYYQSYLTNSSNSLKKQGQQELNSLADALQSGDLSGTQSTFASLMQMLPGSSSPVNGETQSAAISSAAGSSNGASSITNDLSMLGQAIQSGDLTGAQNDFSKLMQDMQSIGGGHHHHHHKASASSQDTTIASASGSGTNSISTDLAALGQALQSGDVKSAGDAYSQLTKDMQSIKQASQSQNTFAELQSTNSTINSNVGFQQLLNMWTQVISAGSSINTSA
jgi:hypothetical protein